MCGIVGLFLKNPALEPQLGALTARMLGTMCDRGPDSAGFAVYGSRSEGAIKLTLRGPAATDFDALAATMREAGFPVTLTVRDTHAVLSLPSETADAAAAWLADNAPAIAIVGRGERMTMFKEVGMPDRVATRFGLAGMAGTHAIGHTRMATESAVTINGAHPYSTGPDQCLVHNGSLSNHNNIRRILRHEGLDFATDNDTEVAAGYLTWRMSQGLALGDALKACLADLDGFYTFVVGTENGFGVLRDGVACKPAVMAETDDYVAFGSEYRALADLPGIETARVWEPEPATVYFWER
jgi:methylamine---glutamate N-methyltransferase subunit A